MYVEMRKLGHQEVNGIAGIESIKRCGCGKVMLKSSRDVKITAIYAIFKTNK
jgi:hypothetical protein